MPVLHARAGRACRCRAARLTAPLLLPCPTPVQSPPETLPCEPLHQNAQALHNHCRSLPKNCPTTADHCPTTLADSIIVLDTTTERSLPNHCPTACAESVIVLDTAEAVQAFTKSQWSVDTDITGACAAPGHRPERCQGVVGECASWRVLQPLRGTLPGITGGRDCPHRQAWDSHPTPRRTFLRPLCSPVPPPPPAPPRLCCQVQARRGARWARTSPPPPPT